MKVAIVYWSGTGNTESIAKLLEQGVKTNNKEVDLIECNNFNVDSLSDYDSYAFGCPSMGAEELEDSEFQPMWDSVKDKLENKKVLLFGSYGWGTGEWMDTWKNECSNINLVDTFICCGEPSKEDGIKCFELSKLV